MTTLRWAIIGAVAIIGIAITSAGAESKSATELLEDAKQIPQKTVELVKKEYAEAVEFQRASWQSGKEQNAKNVAKIKSFFSTIASKLGAE